MWTLLSCGKGGEGSPLCGPVPFGSSEVWSNLGNEALKGIPAEDLQELPVDPAAQPGMYGDALTAGSFEVRTMPMV